MDEKAVIALEGNQPVGANAEPPAWLRERDILVRQAVQTHNVSELQRLSAKPGGFGSVESRRNAWRELLDIDQLLVDNDVVNSAPAPEDQKDDSAFPRHPDEEQVLLDTKRAFVSYPKDPPGADKLAMQEDLQELIVTVLRRHPALSYFQGFHDIMTVLYLTMLKVIPRHESEKQVLDNQLDWDNLLLCAEVVALCHVRDAMGKDLAPMMAMLKLLRRVLAAADPGLYRISASISPVPTLPFFALSWILTLFSHDVDTLEPVQRIFDYLIARNPISAIYLAVAILMAKKPQMMRLASELGSEVQHDPSLLHPLFSRLPPLYADTPDAPQPAVSDSIPDVGPYEPNPYSPITLSAVFLLADKLQAKYPWDGPIIRGYEVLGPGSVVNTYGNELGPNVNDPESDQKRDEKKKTNNNQEDEKSSGPDDLKVERRRLWTLAPSEQHINNQVIQPGGDTLDDDEAITEPAKPNKQSPIRMPINRIGTTVAIGVVAIGIGVALLGWRSGGRHATWAKFWDLVGRSWLSRSKPSLVVTLRDYLRKTLYY